jgi:hypothetical protein
LKSPLGTTLIEEQNIDNITIFQALPEEYYENISKDVDLEAFLDEQQTVLNVLAAEANGKISLDNKVSNENIGINIVLPPDDGTIFLGARDRIFTETAASDVKAIIVGIMSGLATTATAVLSSNPVTAGIVATFSYGVTQRIVDSIKAEYTTTRLVKWYSSTYKQYVYQYATYVWPNSNKTGTPSITVSGVLVRKLYNGKYNLLGP